MVGAPNRELGRAAARGTAIHEYAWALITGVDVVVPDEHRGPAEAAARIMDALRMVPVLREVPVFHVEHGWAGTIDLLADLGPDRWLLDWKTGRSIFDDAALQLAAYNHAQFYAGEDGEPLAWVPAGRCGVVHITADDATLHPVTVDLEEAYRTFRYCQQVAYWTVRCKEAWNAGTPWPIGNSVLARAG
jgi:hypothetical protein